MNADRPRDMLELYLLGELPQDQAAVVEHWLETDPHGAESLTEARRLVALLDAAIAPPAGTAQLSEKILASLDLPGPRSWKNLRKAFWAAIIAAAACLLWGLNIFLPRGGIPPVVPNHAELSTAPATLASGWTVRPTGRAAYRVVSAEHVVLDHGELMIQSVKQAATGGKVAPLRIETPAGTALAVGTEFLIGAYQESDLKPFTRKGSVMNSFTRVLVLAGVVTLSNALGSASGGPNHLLAAEAGRAPTDYAVKSNADFAANLFARLDADHQGKNLFFSPFSICSALAMTAEGARGQTADEMGRVLCFPESARRIGDEAQLLPWNVALIHTGMAALNQRYNAAKKSYELRVANALWGEQSRPFSRTYVDTIHKYYSTGGLFPVDFRGNSEAARQQINSWVESQTAGKIRDLIAQGSIDSSTRLVLTNAIYFKGAWEHPFNKRVTRPADFSVSTAEKIKVPMMLQEEKFRYAENDQLQVLEMPYKGGDLSMLVLLPRSADGLTEVEKSLSAKKITELRGKLKRRGVIVSLPRFKSEMAFELKKPLEALGMRKAFTADADFTGIDPQGYFTVSAVVHKAFVEVNEVGTEAAAATAVEGAGTGMPQPEPPPAVFRADHPFLFMICDNHSGAVLFLGRMCNPGI